MRLTGLILLLLLSYFFNPIRSVFQSTVSTDSDIVLESRILDEERLDASLILEEEIKDLV